MSKISLLFVCLLLSTVLLAQVYNTTFASMNNNNGLHGLYGLYNQISATKVAINTDYTDAIQRPHRGFSRYNLMIICEMAITSRSPKSV
jgi:hypothetical protein